MKIIPEINTASYQKILDKKNNIDFKNDLAVFKSIDPTKNDRLGFKSNTLNAVKNPLLGIKDQYKCSEIALLWAKKASKSTANLIDAKVTFLCLAGYYANICETTKKSVKLAKAILCENNYKLAAATLQNFIEEKDEIEQLRVKQNTESTNKTIERYKNISLVKKQENIIEQAFPALFAE